MRRTPHIVLALAAAVGVARSAHTQEEVRVISPRAAAVSVTIYRDNLALVTESRTVDLPAGPVTLVIEDVVDTLLPQSAVIREVGRPLAESNFDFDQLTPRTLLEGSIGKVVTLTRTNPATGRVTRVAATILAVGEGVVLRTAAGNEALYCSGLPERLELAEVPSELVAKPQLSVRLGAGSVGARTVQVSYLAQGFAWSSDYVAELNERSDRMQLRGWATLTNSSGSAFVQADVQLVAGRLNLVSPASADAFAAASDRPPRAARGFVQADATLEAALLKDCFAADLPLKAAQETIQAFADQFRPEMFMRAAASAEEITVTAARAEREELGDYQLYRLPWRSDLAARQTKQVLFLDEPAVRVERFYGLRLASFVEGLAENIVAPNLVLRFENTRDSGLGQPLPRGTVRVFEPYAEQIVFAGEAEVGDRPIGLPVELTIGRALNVALEVTTNWSQGAGVRANVAAEHRIVNNKAVPVDIEIRHAADSYLTDTRLDSSSKPMRRKYGDFAWRFVVPPGEEVLRYQLSAREPR